MILLDTHALLWLIGDDPQLGGAAREVIRKASAADLLFLSPISLWEIALKSSRGKLKLDLPLRPWMRRTLELTGVRLAPLSIETACSCAELPTEFHGDPADRLIAATARAEGMVLLTHDRHLLRLAKQGLFQALKI